MVRAVARPLALALRACGVTPPERLFRHLHKSGPFSVALPGQRGTLRLMSWGNRVENELFWRGWSGHEPASMRWWGRAALEANCILDIGANTGTFGFIAKALSPSANVHAFEPLARIASLLEENRIVSELDISVFQMAVADQEGELPIHDPGGANAYSASLDPEFLPGTKNSYLVPVTTIDAHCATHQLQPDLIKIDVEGLEGRLLLGASTIIAQKRALFLCEWLANSDAHDAAKALLEEHGYVFIDPETCKKTALDASREFGDRNVLLCPGERVEALLSQGPL